MKNIAIIGTAGVPAKYGGFETLVEYLTKHLGTKVNITVYCSSKIYKSKMKEYNGAKLKYLPINANGITSILYDIVSLFLSARKNDSILILGVSGAIVLPIFKLFFKSKRLIINIDGLEHRREKWGRFAKKFLKYSEAIAIKYGDEIVSDNQGIYDYVEQEYGVASNLIAYGGDHVLSKAISESTSRKFGIPQNYAFKVCRIEPENNVHIILDAFRNIDYNLIIVGNWENSDYGRNLFHKYNSNENISLLSPIYNQDILNEIRSNCSIYIHGHSAGGTNPSLVEAMALGLAICAYDVDYNRFTTAGKAIYFKDTTSLMNTILSLKNEHLEQIGASMKDLVLDNYTWDNISKKYKQLF